MSQNHTTTIIEEPEVTEIVGPGKLLATAREQQGLSTKDVSDRLNFRLGLVENIEKNQFDRTLPATYNRGYLKSYAKLVNISESEVLESYEKLSAVEEQDAGIQHVVLQSFSKETEKQAENNRLMWVSYLILAILVGSTLMWWLQDGKLDAIQLNNDTTEEATNATTNLGNETVTAVSETLDDNIADVAETESLPSQEFEQTIEDEAIAPENAMSSTNENNNNSTESDAVLNDTDDNTNTETAFLENLENSTSDPITEILADPVEVSFTFLGDCWVNIYDASGERIAWGIKKAEYEMKINGHPPFSITLGKPELVSIVFDGSEVDMSQFNRGNIAKFSLPLE
ncbi:RodZ domain-containing protein [Thalassotalea profundi]|uniref:Membrane protein n=1 Tax=Thalassotalea profundi TaxID=2036687 RepID=A0ABQ3IU94_9GAMM|nr:RodZ domain-containing protein [Thalassotalea profundi]GHE94528.1 membrane protein [Thalassotalea profundi]